MDWSRWWFFNHKNNFIFLEHFIVWVRASGTPNFRKLYARSDENIPAGTYKVKINNVYDQSKFNGEKLFILTTSSILGGKNPWL